MRVALLVSCCLLILFQVVAFRDESTAEGEGDEEVTGTSRSTHYRLYRETCHKAFKVYADLAEIEDMEDVYSDFLDFFYTRAGELLTPKIVHSKFCELKSSMHNVIFPLADHKNSMCRGMNITCCRPGLEKATAALANNEFKFYYAELFKAHSESCIAPGKRFFSKEDI